MVCDREAATIVMERKIYSCSSGPGPGMTQLILTLLTPQSPKERWNIRISTLECPVPIELSRKPSCNNLLGLTIF